MKIKIVDCSGKEEHLEKCQGCEIIEKEIQLTPKQLAGGIKESVKDYIQFDFQHESIDNFQERIESLLKDFETSVRESERENTKHWYFIADDLILKKGQWVITRISNIKQKLSQPQTKEGA